MKCKEPGCRTQPTPKYQKTGYCSKHQKAALTTTVDKLAEYKNIIEDSKAKISELQKQKRALETAQKPEKQKRQTLGKIKQQRVNGSERTMYTDPQGKSRAFTDKTQVLGVLKTQGYKDITVTKKGNITGTK